MRDELIRDLCKVHADQGFLMKSDVRKRLDALVAEAVLQDRLAYRPAARADAKTELLAIMDEEAGDHAKCVEDCALVEYLNRVKASVFASTSEKPRF